ncbi:stage V sporulation protein AF [Sporosarcina newyorkensis 2681]|uniref:Stage V sporulation protein AF n=1 Tax=Sporosarcina newyorkensis 2681 TaxID=1027292 RepID=F9DNW9_9BACL|nr:spore germination protein [Sporosarcina newyorkensis]EGQ27508.1 stage V sporulation protein AF [Sporosarcina newyorkensis 2681]
MTKNLFKSIREGERWFINQFGEDETYDATRRLIHLWDKEILLLYMNGLVDGEVLTTLLTEMQYRNELFKDASSDEGTDRAMIDYFPYHALEVVEDEDTLAKVILSGLAVFVMSDGFTFTLDVRNYPGRQPEEPDTEKVIRGSRDGFTENILTNTSLIRRRLRATELRFEMHETSVKGKTDIAIAFLKGAANKEHLDFVRKRLDDLKTDGLTMTDKSLEEFLFKQGFHPMPFVRYTERADICAAHLLEGHIAIIVDTSPSVILVPVTLVHHLQHAEEYRQAPLIGTIIRGVRFIGTFFSLVMLPFWYLLSTKSEFVPEAIKYIGPNEWGEVPLFVQLILADVGIEILRMAAIHTPTPLSTAMGLVAAIVIGQVAIDVGLFSSEVVLYVAVSAILTFAIPSFELSITTKVFRVFLLVSVALLGAPGFFLAFAFIYYYLCSLKPMNVPYLWPFTPFFPKALLRVLIRFPMTIDDPRPFVTKSPNRDRMS